MGDVWKLGNEKLKVGVGKTGKITEISGGAVFLVAL